METRGAHLTLGQIILLLRPENEPGGPPNNLEEHLRICSECRELKEQCEATMAEVNGWDGNASVPIDCPAAEAWTQFAARLLSRERMEELLEHLSACDRCGVLLKEALEDIQSDAPPAPEIHGKLKTSNAKQQGRIAREILDRRLPENGGLAGTSSASAFFHRLTPRAALLTAVVLTTVAVALSWRFWPRSDSVEKLLSLAYAKKRTLELRIPGAAYGPVQAQRAASHTQHDNPAALLHAELIIKDELEKNPDNPDLLRQQAEADLLNWDFQPAIETLGQAIRVEPASALVLVDLASAHFERAEASDSPADYETALEYLGQAIRAAPNDHAALFNRAVIYERLFLYDPAIADWKKLLSLEKDQQWRNEEESRLRDLRLKKQRPRSTGHSLQPLNAMEVEQALKHPDEADSETDAEEYIESAERELLPNISRRDMKDRNYPAAILVARYLEQAHGDRFLSDILRAADAPEFHEAAGFLGKAAAANSTGLSEQALTLARQSERLFQQAASPAGVLAAKFEQAYALHFQSQAGQCAATASKTASLAHKRNYPWLQTQALLEEAMCNIMKNDLGHAKVLVNSAIRIAETHHYQGFYLRGLLVLAYLEADAGDETSAWSAIRQGLQIFWAGRFRPVRGYSFYTVLETLAERLGHDSVQYAAAVQALSFIGDNPSRMAEAATRSRLAAVALRLGETKTAENELATAVQLFSAMPQTASVRWRVIWAKVWLAKAQATQNSYHGDMELALQSLSPEVEQLANRVLSFEYYSILGETQSQQGQFQEAEHSLEAAIKLAESSLPSLRTWQEQLTQIRQLRRPYLLLTEIMFRSGRQKAALELWQRFRLAEAGFSREPGRSQNVAASSSFEPPASYRDSSTILTYALTDEALIIWAREHNGLHSIRVPMRIADLRRVAENFLGECSRPDSDLSRLRADAHLLYEWLIKPVVRWLPPTGRIIVEPDGILSMLPFNAMVDDSEAYLGATYSITTSLAAGGNQVPDSSVSVRSSDRALLVAAPAPLGRSVEASTEAHREVDHLASKFSATDVLAGHDATVGALKKKLAAARVFHFAGHAGVGRDGAEIVMADGIVGIAGKRFHAGRVLNLPAEKDLLRNTRLAVFSACATARPSEALQADSLVTEFIRAGVPSVTASRWNVDSVATTSFMVSFYDSLLSGHTVDSALQIAASRVRASSAWIHPYYWAAFGAFGHS